MRSLISVYNTALARLGGHQFERINTPDEDGTVASLCRTLFPHVLEVALAHVPWRFARQIASLAQKDAGEFPDQQYPLRFGLPRDCVRPIRLRSDVRFVISGPDLLTASNPAVLEYTARIEEPANWPAHFADALAWALAAELSTALINDPRRQQYYWETAKNALDQAAATERNSQKPETARSPWIGER